VSWLPQSPRLRRILAAYTVNKLGTWFGTVALSLALYDHTHSAAAVTALFIARYLPALAVPALVARVEASPRHGWLGFLYGIEAITTAVLAVLLWHFWLPAILALVALDGAGALTASSLLRAEAARGETGSTDADEESTEQAASDANAALNVALSITVVAGPAIAAIAVKLFGGPVALLIDAASFLLCGTLLINLYPYVEERAGTSVRARLAAAWEHVRHVPALHMALLTQALALVFFETAAPVEVFYAEGALKAGDIGYGVLLAVWGVGMIGGSLFFARAARRSLGAMLTFGTLAVGLAYIGFAAAPSLVLAACAALLGGVGNGVQWASLIGVVQQLTPQRLHGQLMGAVESIGALCPLIGLALSGIVMTLSSPRITFLLFGCAASATTFGFARLWKSGLLRTLHPGGASSAPEPPIPKRAGPEPVALHSSPTLGAASRRSSDH
jgi:MFS family permease